MALIKCVECGKEISDKANACIHCGSTINIKTVFLCRRFLTRHVATFRSVPLMVPKMNFCPSSGGLIYS